MDADTHDDDVRRLATARAMLSGAGAGRKRPRSWCGGAAPPPEALLRRAPLNPADVAPPAAPGSGPTGSSALGQPPPTGGPSLAPYSQSTFGTVALEGGVPPGTSAAYIGVPRPGPPGVRRPPPGPPLPEARLAGSGVSGGARRGRPQGNRLRLDWRHQQMSDAGLREFAASARADAVVNESDTAAAADALRATGVSPPSVTGDDEVDMLRDQRLIEDLAPAGPVDRDLRRFLRFRRDDTEMRLYLDHVADELETRMLRRTRPFVTRNPDGTPIRARRERRPDPWPEDFDGPPVVAARPVPNDVVRAHVLPFLGDVPPGFAPPFRQRHRMFHSGEVRPDTSREDRDSLWPPLGSGAPPAVGAGKRPAGPRAPPSSLLRAASIAEFRNHMNGHRFGRDLFRNVRADAIARWGQVPHHLDPADPAHARAIERAAAQQAEDVVNGDDEEAKFARIEHEAEARLRDRLLATFAPMATHLRPRGDAPSRSLPVAVQNTIAEFLPHADTWTARPAGADIGMQASQNAFGPLAGRGVRGGMQRGDPPPPPPDAWRAAAQAHEDAERARLAAAEAAAAERRDFTNRVNALHARARHIPPPHVQQHDYYERFNPAHGIVPITRADADREYDAADALSLDVKREIANARDVATHNGWREGWEADVDRLIELEDAADVHANTLHGIMVERRERELAGAPGGHDETRAIRAAASRVPPPAVPPHPRERPRPTHLPLEVERHIREYLWRGPPAAAVGGSVATTAAAKHGRGTKAQEGIALSDSDISGLVPGIRILTYPQLARAAHIEELVPRGGAIVVLFLTQSARSGHWTSVLHHDADPAAARAEHLEYFDSYGGLPDAPLRWISPAKRHALDETNAVLTRLLKASPLPVVYNNAKLQERDDDVATCGRHVVVRLWHRASPLAVYVTALRRAGSPDAVVTHLTAGPLAALHHKGVKGGGAPPERGGMMSGEEEPPPPPPAPSPPRSAAEAADAAARAWLAARAAHKAANSAMNAAFAAHGDGPLTHAHAQAALAAADALAAATARAFATPGAHARVAVLQPYEVGAMREVANEGRGSGGGVEGGGWEENEGSRNSIALGVGDYCVQYQLRSRNARAVIVRRVHGAFTNSARPSQVHILRCPHNRWRPPGAAGFVHKSPGATALLLLQSLTNAWPERGLARRALRVLLEAGCDDSPEFAGADLVLSASGSLGGVGNDPTPAQEADLVAFYIRTLDVEVIAPTRLPADVPRARVGMRGTVARTLARLRDAEAGRAPSAAEEQRAGTPPLGF